MNSVPGLKRVLGPVDAAWLVAGNMIGAGIFYTPGLVAGQLPGLVWPLAAWTAGGLLALSVGKSCRHELRLILFKVYIAPKMYIKCPCTVRFF